MSFGKVYRKVVLNDTANLNVRQRKCLGQIFEALGFRNSFFENLAVKGSDRTVGPDGASFDVDDVFAFYPKKRDLDIGVLAPSSVRILIRK